ncbi:Esat-6 like protein EsxO [Mycobacterium tuberculosis]|nr:Esat-6 like protein EsxO [Mycobacterium tuberculosis]
MTINYQFGDVDAHGAMIRAQAGLLEAEHQAIVRDVLAAGDFWGGAGSVACQEFITQLGRNFQVIYEQANAGRRCRLPATTWHKPTAPSAPAGPDRVDEP